MRQHIPQRSSLDFWPKNWFQYLWNSPSLSEFIRFKFFRLFLIRGIKDGDWERVILLALVLVKNLWSIMFKTLVKHISRGLLENCVKCRIVRNCNYFEWKICVKESFNFFKTSVAVVLKCILFYAWLLVPFIWVLFVIVSGTKWREFWNLIHTMTSPGVLTYSLV